MTAGRLTYKKKGGAMLPGSPLYSGHRPRSSSPSRHSQPSSSMQSSPILPVPTAAAREAREARGRGRMGWHWEDEDGSEGGRVVGWSVVVAVAGLRRGAGEVVSELANQAPDADSVLRRALRLLGLPRPTIYIDASPPAYLTLALLPRPPPTSAAPATFGGGFLPEGGSSVLRRARPVGGDGSSALRECLAEMGGVDVGKLEPWGEYGVLEEGCLPAPVMLAGLDVVTWRIAGDAGGTFSSAETVGRAILARLESSAHGSRVVPIASAALHVGHPPPSSAPLALGASTALRLHLHEHHPPPPPSHDAPSSASHPPTTTRVSAFPEERYIALTTVLPALRSALSLAGIRVTWHDRSSSKTHNLITSFVPSKTHNLTRSVYGEPGAVAGVAQVREGGAGTSGVMREMRTSGEVEVGMALHLSGGGGGEGGGGGQRAVGMVFGVGGGGGGALGEKVSARDVGGDGAAAKRLRKTLALTRLPPDAPSVPPPGALSEEGEVEKKGRGGGGELAMLAERVSSIRAITEALATAIDATAVSPQLEHAGGDEDALEGGDRQDPDSVRDSAGGGVGDRLRGAAESFILALWSSADTPHHPPSQSHIARGGGGSAVESEALEAARGRVLGAASAAGGGGGRREVLEQLLNVGTLLRSAARWHEKRAGERHQGERSEHGLLDAGGMDGGGVLGRRLMEGLQLPAGLTRQVLVELCDLLETLAGDPKRASASTVKHQAAGSEAGLSEERLEAGEDHPSLRESEWNVRLDPCLFLRDPAFSSHPAFRATVSPP
ncbi:hypothetical protein T484DRAFT_1883642, partial [Baffinella frigidus]